MTTVDYSQTAEDHQSFLVLIRPTGKLVTAKHFSRCWERICQLDCVAIPGQNRNMWIRYKRSYSKDCNEWGDFQAHRKALGLVCVGCCVNHQEFEDLFESYKTEKERYEETLFNSKLIVFGMNSDRSQLTDMQKVAMKDMQTESPKAGQKKMLHGSSSPQLTLKIDDGVMDSADVHLRDSLFDSKSNNALVTPVGDISCPQMASFDEDLDPLHSTLMLPVPIDERGYTPQAEDTSNKSDKLVEEVSSQITFIRQKSEKSAKQKVPKTAKNAINSNGSTNSLRDAPGSEVVFYPSVDNCQGLEENVKEFVTSLFFVLEGKRLDRCFERGDKLHLLCAPFEKKDFVGVDTDTKSYKKKCQGRYKKHLADLSLLAGLPGEAILHYTTAIDILKPFNDWLWIGACYEGLCSATVITLYGWSHSTTSTTLRRNQSFTLKKGAGQDKQRKESIKHSYAVGLQDLAGQSGKSNLSPNDIVEKYKEALMYYSKYKNAAVIEMEASFKACRVVILQQKYLDASDFLQNVVYINLQLSDEDRIQRYIALSSLYNEIGFHRKGSFFKRVAAMQCVAPQNPKPNWTLCHHLLVQALPGYKIYLDPKESTGKPGVMNGWPALQVRVFNELVFSARRMGNIPLAVRYITIMLHTQLDYLSELEKREIVTNLFNFAQRCEGTTQPLALDSGVIVPHVPLLNIPLVKSFKLLPLDNHLEPRKMNINESAKHTVFIFTPLNLGIVDTEIIKTDVDFCWVAGDISNVQLEVCNPMPDALQITISLITEGVDIEPFVVTPNIPADSGLFTVKIRLRPCVPGDLKILGYSTKLFGVQSNCRLKDCPNFPQPFFMVKVVPALPTIQLTSSLPKSASFLSFGEEFNIVTSGTAVLYTGQSLECEVTIQNNSKVAVEMVNVNFESSREAREYVHEVFQWNDDNIKSQLPIQQCSLLVFTLAIHGVGDFLLPHSRESCKTSNNNVNNKAVSSEGKCVEAILKVEYSGGPGMLDQYCRFSSLALSIDVLPSVAFHVWDVMQSESSDHCYLLFEIQNVSGHELTLAYSGQTVSYKVNMVKRICIEVEKCQPKAYKENQNPGVQFSHLLATFVDIRWSIPSLKITGKVGIENLHWSLEQQQLVYLSPLSWDVRINGQLLSPPFIDSLEYKVGEIVRLDVEVTVKDMADIDNRAGVLTICCCQYCENGSLIDDTEQYISTIGTNSLVISQILPDTPITHSCSYMFTCSGFYRFEIMMQIKGQDHVESISNCAADNRQTIKCSSIIEVNVME